MRFGKYYMYKDVVCMIYVSLGIEYLYPIRSDHDIGNGAGLPLKVTDELKDKLKPVKYNS
jgi:hypothetical protein